MVNVNIEMPDDLHRELKIAAVTKGTTIKQLLIDILSREDDAAKRR